MPYKRSTDRLAQVRRIAEKHKGRWGDGDTRGVAASNGITIRTCRKCLVEKNILAFSIQRRLSDGVHGWCRECLSLYNKERRELNINNSALRLKYNNFKVK